MPFPVGQARNGGDPAAVGLDCQHAAGLHAVTVEQDRTGAAIGGVAPHRSAHQAQPVAQPVHEQQPGFDFVIALDAVHIDADPGHP